MMSEVSLFCPKNKQDWRNWLQKHHVIEDSVWILYYKTSSGKRTLTWSDAVDEALCFGWIDSKAVSLDDETYKQFFTKRKPKSVWSKVNKEKVARFIETGMMTEAGLKCIEIAKQNGSWNALDEVEEMVMPKDLELALQQNGEAYPYFMSLSKSIRKGMLYWVSVAKKLETRQGRIDEIVLKASQKQKPKQF